MDLIDDKKAFYNSKLKCYKLRYIKIKDSKDKNIDEIKDIIIGIQQGIMEYKYKFKNILCKLEPLDKQDKIILGSLLLILFNLRTYLKI